ncbi:hypothetical protein GM547_13415 [Streptococcus pneumoniae]|uniref:hypothetical protein n=1 Tax=Streptococcus pneumoniae TaxID=1313 RepID=UPI0012D7DA17|nr:hypothetical protein [Streptococcus pneumoniae]MTV59043.1 hypothetical protein [Streptococcus pneumoniae]
MRHAIVIDGAVVNVVIWDGNTEFNPGGELIALPDDSAVSPGWTLVDGEWLEPEPVTEVVDDRQSALDKLLTLGLTEEEALAIAGV